ncbi:InlB B-repeat-containing protein, partial [Candidatus Saccharibacteria bacterium]|nr:InlB B-repeat-containing protein [Candidatus Saccharibacteria bacterium]
MFIKLSKAVHRRNAVFALLFCSVLMVLSILLVPETLPADTSATTGVEATPTMTINGSHALELTVNPGQFGTSESQNLVVTTTNYTGYTMTIAPSTGESTELVNTTLNTATIPSIASATTATSFQNQSSAAYGLSVDNGTNYLPVTTDATIKSTNAATDSTTGAFTLKLGAKTQADTPAGTYTNSFTLTSTANPALYSITFDANAGSDTVTNIPTGAQLSGAEVVLPFTPTPTRTDYRFLGWDTNQNAIEPTYTSSGVNSFPIDPELDQSANTRTLYAIWGCGSGKVCYHSNGADAGTMGNQAISNATSSGLIAPNFSRAGYGFAGWNTKADGTGTTFGPNQTLTAQEAGDGLDLYAKWVPAEKDGNNNPVYFQGWMGCSGLQNGEVTALTDIRDNDVYAIAKLADGNCWMIENLRLDYDANITPINTQSNGAFGGVFTGLAEPESANFANSTTANSIYSTSIITGSSQSYRFPRYNNNNTASRTTNLITSGNANIYSYGNYYTWSAAIADTTYYSTRNQSVTSTSLCPTGWHLPTEGNKDNFANSEWWTLTRTIIGANPANYDSSSQPYYTNNSNTEGTDASKAMRRYPINLVYSGYFIGSSASQRGTVGSYWSSTIDGGAYADRAELNSNSVNPTSNGYMYNGHPVRCLASDIENFTLTYDANGGDLASVPQSQTATVNGIHTFTVSSTIPTRSGYTFAGWIDERGTEISKSEAESGNAVYTTFSANTTLYARWTNNTCNPFATTIGTGNNDTDAKCLQDINATVKSTMSVADSTTGTY